MNINIKKAATSVAVAASLVAFAGWRYIAIANAPSPPHSVLITDTSDSMQRDCDVEMRMVRALVLRSTRRGATLTLLQSGDDSTRLEPRMVFSETLPPSPSMAPFGGRKKAVLAMKAFLQRASAACKGMGQTTQSPVVKAVRRGVTHLNSLRCNARSGCLLVVHSDMQDNDELARQAQTVDGTASKIDNREIEVILCGFSEGKRDKDSAPTEVLLAKWKRLFVAPMTIAPFCGEAILAARLAVPLGGEK